MWVKWISHLKFKDYVVLSNMSTQLPVTLVWTTCVYRRSELILSLLKDYCQSHYTWKLNNHEFPPVLKFLSSRSHPFTLANFPPIFMLHPANGSYHLLHTLHDIYTKMLLNGIWSGNTCISFRWIPTDSITHSLRWLSATGRIHTAQVIWIQMQKQPPW